jgi:hypothetical protein
VLQWIDACLDPVTGPMDTRRALFIEMVAILRAAADPNCHQLADMAGIMERFAPGLFADDEKMPIPDDNLDLERWFRIPKRHQRHIHGRAHAGVRIVHQGPTLMLVLDAHEIHRTPFSPQELIPYWDAQTPPSQQEALRRASLMRQARSRKRRPVLLADLERRYIEGIEGV